MGLNIISRRRSTEKRRKGGHRWVSSFLIFRIREFGSLYSEGLVVVSSSIRCLEIGGKRVLHEQRGSSNVKVVVSLVTFLGRPISLGVKH